MNCKDECEKGMDCNDDDNEKPPQTSAPSLRGQCSPLWTCEQSRYKRSFDRDVDVDDDEHYHDDDEHIGDNGDYKSQRKCAFKQLDCGHNMMPLVTLVNNCVGRYIYK